MRVPSARTRLLIHSAPYKFGSHHSTHRSAPLQIPTPAHPDLSAARPAPALLLGARRRLACLPTRTTADAFEDDVCGATRGVGNKRGTRGCRSSGAGPTSPEAFHSQSPRADRHCCLSFASEPAMAIAIIRPTHRREPCPGEHRRHTQGPGPAQARAIEAKLARVHLSSSQRRCSLPGMMHCRGYDASSGPPRACVCSLQSWIWTRGLGLARLGRTPDSQRAFSGVPLLDDSVPLRGPHHWCGTGAPTMRRR